ncbi:MFS transporter [Allonocardiopsis opalescens]|uniref:Putative MFS family arabinose efflux permease n=1 Tax=Allonocardiopsis opalescens TaxID=1144618 RepID=A0A2T0QEX7_9ACTN|nr:MFS transporter [Allonocardiopsis opalescens]PRY02496.1 putative MFS family arabinose efflux permease [Allonocardiopsis opalescens]
MRRFLRRLRHGRTDPPEGFDRRLLVPMVLGSILNPVNSSMLAVALIPIGRAFDAPPAQTAWLVTGLYLATAVGQPVAGRLVDAFGPRRLYLAGTALVGCAGLLGVLAPDLWILVASRVLLGFGTSAAYPASMSLLRAEADRTGTKNPSGVLAALTLANQIVTVAGPTLGGLLIGAGGWYLVFAVNVPLAAACLVLGALRLPAGGAAAARTRTDVLGMALFAGSLTMLMTFLMAPAAQRWYLAAAGAAAGAAFVHRQLAVAHPFIDLRVLGGKLPLLATYARQFLAYTVTYTFLYGYGQWLQDGRGIDTASAGLIQLPMALAAIAITVPTGRNPRVRGKLVAGSLVQLAGCAALLLLGPDSPVWLLLVLAAVFGVPHGLSGLANQNALYAQADPERIGASAGLLRTATYFGALLSAAATAAFFQDGATTAGMHGLAWPMTGAALLLLAASLADRSLRGVGRDG